jgi:hypothetical protein
MYYYYYPSAMILGLALSYALTQTSLAYAKWLIPVTIACAATIFVILMPISSAAIGVTPWLYDRLMLFDSWKIPS